MQYVEVWFMISACFDMLLDIILVMQFGLVHISAGDLLRAEIATGSENGRKAKEFMEKGMLVPDEIVVMVLSFFVVTTVYLLYHLVKAICIGFLLLVQKFNLTPFSLIPLFLL
jgi:Adenylate kinase